MSRRVCINYACNMKAIKETLVSPWKGSSQSEEAVREQIRERWGDETADEFNAASDAMPFSSWVSHGYVVRKGSKALKSITILEVTDKDDKIVRKICRNVNLFHKRQVQKITS